MSLSVERFDRRLVEHIGTVRVEMAQLDGRLRDEIATVRVEMAQLDGCVREEIASVRVEMTRGKARLREEIAQQGTLIRQEIAANRFELLKWSFLFWVGQVVAVVGLVGVMLRAMNPVR